MKRRSFLSATLSTPLVAPVAAAEATWDVIVVGAGTAGLPAAIFASRRGGRVLLIDAAPEIGGTLHLASGQIAGGGTRLQDSKGIQDSPDAHFEDVMRITRGRADAMVVRRTADEAPATLNWLLDAGLTPLPDHPVTGDSPGRPAYTTPRYFWGANEGRDILAVIARELTPELSSGRVQFLPNSRVRRILTRDNGDVDGVRVTTSAGEKTFRGRNVLLTSGGYAMNPTMFRSLIGGPAYAGSSYPSNLGDGLEMVTSIGGSLRGQDRHRAGSGSILTAESFQAKIYARFTTVPQQRQPWEIWVNNAGRRFIREDEPTVYERDRAFAAQPSFRYAIVFDDAILNSAPPGIKGWDREKLVGHFGHHPMFHRADSLGELAALAKVDPRGLAETVAAYNAAVGSGRDGLGRAHLPLPLTKPPYYAIIHLGHSATSSTGVVVDRDLCVLRKDGTRIRNLYAAGEVLGSGATLGDAFAPGMMLTPALALGRWLGNTLPLKV